MVELIRLNNEIQEFRPLFHVWRCLTRWWNIWPQIKIGISFTWIDKRAQPYHFLISQRNRRKEVFEKWIGAVAAAIGKNTLDNMTYFCFTYVVLRSLHIIVVVSSYNLNSIWTLGIYIYLNHVSYIRISVTRVVFFQPNIKIVQGPCVDQIKQQQCTAMARINWTFRFEEC